MSTGEIHGVHVVTTEGSEQLDVCVELPGTEKNLRHSNPNPAIAVVEFLAEVENLGWRLLCHRSRTDVVLSGSANGLLCYVTEGRKKVNPQTDLVSSFSPADPKFLPSSLQSAPRSQISERRVLDRTRANITRSGSRNQLGSEKLLEKYGQEIWFKPVSGSQPAAGNVYQSEFLGGRCIFGRVNEVGANGEVIFQVYSFLVDTSNTIPTKLFTDANAVENLFALEATNWQHGYFRPVGHDPTWTGLDKRASKNIEAISIGEFSRSVVELLGITPWFSI